MNDREFATKRLEQTAAARRLIETSAENHAQYKAQEVEFTHSRNKYAAQFIAFAGATAVASEQFDLPPFWQFAGYASSGISIANAVLEQRSKRFYRKIASGFAEDAYNFSKKDFVGLPTPTWIQEDPAYKKFKQV